MLGDLVMAVKDEVLHVQLPIALQRVSHMPQQCRNVVLARSGRKALGEVLSGP